MENRVKSVTSLPEPEEDCCGQSDNKAKMFLVNRLRNFYNEYIAVPLGLGQPTPERRADLLLSREVRNKWESEQEEMKRQMKLEDTDHLQAMMNLNSHVPDQQFYVGGVDISFVKGDDVNACAAIVILSFPQLKVVYEDCQMIQLTEPYVPGFLGFREVPYIQDLYEKLKGSQPHLVPQVLMVDGNGLLHPKGFGSACHLGVKLGVSCIGVAKKLFHVDGLEKDQDHHQKIEDCLKKGGDTFPLIGTSQKVWGMALRSCNNSKNPVYVSPGHLVTMETAVALVHQCCKHRVPEPVRLADIKSREYLRESFHPVDGGDNS